MVFSEKLTELRRIAGISQEQLADQLGVTRQSVSKWESGAAMPELSKLIALSDLFGVSIDYLVKDNLSLSEQPAQKTAKLEQRLNALEGEYRQNFGPYFKYTSKRTLFGLPLLSICFGRNRHPSKYSCAVGIIAIGNFSVGIISIGLISLGLFSLGMVSFGGISFGMVALGWIARGISVIGASVRGIAALNITEFI